MSALTPIEQAAEAAEAAFIAMRDAAPEAQMHSTLIVPPNAPADDMIVFGLPIPPGSAFPPNDVAISRLQQVLDEGMALYMLSSDSALLGRYERLVRALAQTVAPPAVS